MNRGNLMPMISDETTLTEENLNIDLIDKQLKKILSHPLFSRSAILCKFLTFIVHETLRGNANQIKEYTIALHVLNKPANFDPQQNAIVRIHASRLRLALINYYKSAGNDDVFTIHIPKGRYIPAFRPIKPIPTVVANNLRSKQYQNISNRSSFSVLPFKMQDKKVSRIPFADGIGQTLSLELTKINSYWT